MQIRTCPPRHGSPRGCLGLGWLWRSSNPAREQPNASAIGAHIAARTLAELLAQGARGDNAEGCLPLTSCSPSSCRSCSPHSSSPSSKLVHTKSSAAAGPSHGCGFGQPITKKSQCWAQRVPGHTDPAPNTVLQAKPSSSQLHRVWLTGSQRRHGMHISGHPIPIPSHVLAASVVDLG